MEYLRNLILDEASIHDEIGVIEETLKWGEPAYLTAETKSGTTIRIDWKARSPDQYAMYVSCRTTLVDTYKTLFPDSFKYEGNRSIIFDIDEEVPENELRYCIGMAFRYHLDNAQN